MSLPAWRFFQRKVVTGELATLAGQKARPFVAYAVVNAAPPSPLSPPAVCRDCMVTYPEKRHGHKAEQYCEHPGHYLLGRKKRL